MVRFINLTLTHELAGESVRGFIIGGFGRADAGLS